MNGISVYAEERQQAIASLVMSKGRASVAELAQTYNVTTETVRRDLAALDRAGALRRVHGGAVPARALHVVEPGVIEREATRADYKDAIARAALEFLPVGGGSVLFDAGTTTGRVAALLPSDREFVAVTNSVPIAARLAAMPGVSLQLLGGRVRGLPQASTSPSSGPTRSASGTACPRRTARRPLSNARWSAQPTSSSSSPTRPNSAGKS
jgi:DeoR family fructose operon transcriptional repressor